MELTINEAIDEIIRSDQDQSELIRVLCEELIARNKELIEVNNKTIKRLEIYNDNSTK